MKGSFITLEGIEGVGKTTNTSFIKNFLENSGKKVLVTREPGGTSFGENLREIILEEKDYKLSIITECLIMFAARSQHIEEVIKPALSDDYYVVCDRFTDATYAYQGGGRGLPKDVIDHLKYIVHPDLEPDLTIYLDAPEKISFSRIEDRNKDSFEKEDLAFFKNVRSSYLEQASLHQDRIMIVDASNSLDEVQKDISHYLKVLLDRNSDV
ncbi:MAG: dTMP kinase [Gammaproteobacteria bacterium TMED78]|nr:MAG: dTMP kinase [Gammaproteobacteria bacterium TMED78]|tara:strand:+ start:1116 stop:1748 length:633 start_codon:yes stop_codon:yes gene_type:complete